MRKLILLLSSLIIISGCGTKIIVPIDQSLLSENEATVIIYHDEGYTDQFEVFLDRTPVGIVTSETPLKFSVPEGEHEVHTEVTMAIDRVTKQFYEAGKTYYLKIWLDFGLWVSSIRTDPTPPIKSYEVRSFKSEKAKPLPVSDIVKSSDKKLLEKASVDKPNLSTSVNKHESTLPVDTLVTSSIKQNIDNSKLNIPIYIEPVAAVKKERKAIPVATNTDSPIQPCKSAVNHAPPIKIDNTISQKTPTSPEITSCMSKLKKSAWYSINSQRIKQNHQGEEYSQKMNALIGKIKASCAEQSS